MELMLRLLSHHIFLKNDMSHDAFLKYYLVIADSSPIPILLYNVPVFTGLNMEAKTVAELSSHENIIGLKTVLETLNSFLRLLV